MAAYLALNAPPRLCLAIFEVYYLEMSGSEVGRSQNTSMYIKQHNINIIHAINIWCRTDSHYDAMLPLAIVDRSYVLIAEIRPEQLPTEGAPSTFLRLDDHDDP